MRMILLFFLTIASFSFTSSALTVDTPLPDPAQEMRAKALFHEVRCVVCQSETIADSPAEVARDVRQLVREHVATGKTDAQIKAELVAQYGEKILMRPTLSRSTALLWFAPILLIFVGGLFAWKSVFSKARRR